MVAELAYETKPVVANFYENSFKQCSSVQQKQIGLLIGAAVGDAAAYPLNGWSAEEISLLEKELNKLENECETLPSTSSAKTEILQEHKLVKRVDIAFLQNVQQYILEILSYSSSSSSPEPLAAMSTKVKQSTKRQSHSFTFQLYNELIRTMSRARGDFPLTFVQPQWASLAQETNQHGHEFVNEHASLLHTLNVLLPIPTLYPYANDETLRNYTTPFAEYLTQTAWNLPEINNVSSNENSHICKLYNGEKETEKECTREITPEMLYELAQAEKAAVIAHTMSMLSVALRYLQSSPDAIVNSAHMAIPGTQHAFPRHASKFCKSLSSTHKIKISSLSSSTASTNVCSTLYGYIAERQQMSRNRARAVCTHDTNHLCAIPESFLPRRPVMCDVNVLRESLSIAHVARNFTSGIRTAIRLGGNTAHRAMFVGALLGARFGIRNIPLEWLSSTDGHQALATMAIDIAQWTWNPPHHSEYERITQ